MSHRHCNLANAFLISLILFALAVGVNSFPDEYSNEDSMYGISWMYFPDGDGVPQVANLTEPPNSNARGRLQPVKEKVRFELYTRKVKRDPKVMQLKRRKRDLEEFNESFQSNAPTFIIVHGWKSSTQSDTVQNIKNGYLMTRECNVIAVDWKELASNNFYMVPARQTREVGEYVAQMIDYLVKKQNADINSFHLIGHSLGAHTVGYAGSFTKSGRITRITGLDPARPMFEGSAGPEGSLDKNDAEFVDIIHSSAGSLGYKDPIGDVDFYPNNGKAHQPGCKGLFKELMEACSHGRSHQFFAESITNKKGFTAYPCESWDAYNDGKCRSGGIPMGDATPDTAKGVYYLHTADHAPYAMDGK